MRHWLVLAGVIANAFVMAPAAAQTALTADEQALLTLAERLYPALFVGGQAPGSTQGYTYRHYAGTGVYVGFKDQRLYLLGGPFGDAVREMGTVFGALSQLRVEEAGTQSRVTSEPVPALQNLGLASYDSVQLDPNALREFATFGLKGFYVFGDTLQGGRRNPTFEYSSLKEGTQVVAAMDGVNTFVREQPQTRDFSVFLQPAQGSAWTISYDHLVNLSVRAGDVVKAGTVIGQPARQNNGLLRFEIQVNQDVGPSSSPVTTHFCPALLLADSARVPWQTALATMMGAWETFSGLELYNPSRQYPTGCLWPTLTVPQAAGTAAIQ
jgi:hypothetical protein